MKRISSLLGLLALLLVGMQSSAKIWRVNNTPGISVDFVQVTTAIASSLVQNDDTLHVEGTSIDYNGFTLSKRLVIIGNGYFLSGANSNPGLQANTNVSGFGNQYILVDSTGSGSQLIGLSNFWIAIGPNLGSATDNITISRCNFSGLSLYYSYIANTAMTGWKLNKNYISSSFGHASLVIKNMELRNNIMGSIELQHTANTDNLVRNNVILSAINLYNVYFANNIISASAFNVVNAVVKNNLAVGNPSGFGAFVGTLGNSQGYTTAQLFQGLTGNSLDGQYQLKAGSPAIAAGLTVGAVVNPDCGAFGATDPYRLSGIAPIPSIYSLTVPASIPSGTSSMNVTFSTRNNN